MDSESSPLNDCPSPVHQRPAWWQNMGGFGLCLAGVTGAYLLFILSMLIATATYSTPGDLLDAMKSREIQHSIYLSLLTCSITAMISPPLSSRPPYSPAMRIPSMS